MDPEKKQIDEKPPKRNGDRKEVPKERKDERDDELPPPEKYPPVVEYDD